MPHTSFLDDISEAQRFLSQERPEDAIALCEQLIADNSQNANAYNILGVSYIILGRCAEAVDALKQAISLNDNVASYHINLAQAYLFAHQPDDAIEQLKKALKLHSKSADAHAYMAQAYLQKEQYLWAERHAKKALALQPEHAFAFNFLGNIYTEQKKVEKAIESFEKALFYNPSIAEAHRMLGILQEEEKRHLKALKHLEYALKHYPYDAHGLFSLAHCYKALDMLDEAIEHYRKSLVLQPHNPNIHFHIAECLAKASYEDEALQHYAQVIELAPSRSEAYKEKALLHIHLADFESAQNTLTSAESNNIPAEAIQYPQALLYKHLGDLEQAQNMLESCSKTAEASIAINAEIEHHIADILEAKGWYDDAYDAYASAKKKIVTSEHEVVSYPPLSTINSLTTWTQLTDFNNWPTANPSDNIRSPIFLVGFPQSGGAYVEKILTTHPKILTTHDTPIIDALFNEMSDLLGHKIIYPESINALTEKDITTLRSYYITQAKALFDTNIVQNQIIDKMPLNIMHLGLIYRLFPDAKIITLLRDPRDVCLSCFTLLHHPENKSAYFSSLERSVEFYTHVMRLYVHYKKHLPANLLEVRYEDIVNNPTDFAEKLVSVTGFHWDNNLNNSLPPNPLNLTIGRWRHYARELLPHLAQLDPFIEKFGYSASI